MEATDFTRSDCQLSRRRVSYARLEREYCCNDCGGRITTRWGDEGWYASCLTCGSCNFIHEREAQRQRQEALEVLEGLPPELAAALGYEQRTPSKMLFPLGLPEPMEI